MCMWFFSEWVFQMYTNKPLAFLLAWNLTDALSWLIYNLLLGFQLNGIVLANVAGRKLQMQRVYLQIWYLHPSSDRHWCIHTMERVGRIHTYSHGLIQSPLGTSVVILVLSIQIIHKSEVSSLPNLKLLILEIRWASLTCLLVFYSKALIFYRGSFLIAKKLLLLIESPSSHLIKWLQELKL